MFYGTRGTDIVAYTWNADEYDPSCIATMFGGADGDSAEDVITAYAAASGIDRESRDSAELPQPIFGSDDLYEEPGDGGDTRPRRCGRCHEAFVSE